MASWLCRFTCSYDSSISTLTPPPPRPRPKRTDVGGSRLLHRAILELAKRSKTAPSVRERGSARRSGGEREKMILVPMSMLSEGGAPKKLVVAKKRVLASGGCGYEI